MNVAVIGTGYVGLVTGVCFSEIGHQVVCIDIDAAKIQKLQKGLCPIYEPSLTNYLERNLRMGRLSFSTDLSSIKDTPVVFLAIGTPSRDDGRACLSYLYGALESVIEEMVDKTTIVIKSTVPVTTADTVRDFVRDRTTKAFSIVSNPEFLREGTAVEDFMRPNRVVIGCREKESLALMGELYAPLIKQGNPLHAMSNLSAEMTKYASNCFLATKVSFINEIAGLCDLTGADINEVRGGLGSDERIGNRFLYPGVGFGGSCFPKDIRALQATARDYGMDLKIVRAAEEVNISQKFRMFDKIVHYFGKNLKGKIFTFWGVAFKANTDDVRESAAISFAEVLLGEGANIHFYDPIASDNYLSMMEERGHDLTRITPFEDKYSCLKDSDGLVVLTEWREFSSVDFDRMKANLKHPVIFDGRNLLETKKVLSSGFDYYAVGKAIAREK